MNDSTMIAFYKICKLYNLAKNPTCFENPENTWCRELLLTNKTTKFSNYHFHCTGLSDFNKMIVLVMKMHFPKMKPSGGIDIKPLVTVLL